MIDCLTMRRINSMKHFCEQYWMLEEAAFLTTLAIPPAIVCLTEALQMKMSNIFIDRASGNNVEKMLSALFLGQVVTSCTSSPISDGISILYVSMSYVLRHTELKVQVSRSIHSLL